MTASVLDGVRDLLPTLRERAEETERYESLRHVRGVPDHAHREGG